MLAPSPIKLPSSSPVTSSDRFTIVGVVLIVAALIAAWGNSFTGPMVFDDLPSLQDNHSIQHWSTALTPPSGGFTVSGRPLLNLSFAFNYHLSGTEVANYHVTNLILHGLAALTLFGLVRQTLTQLRPSTLAQRDAYWAALASALLWAVHPLQTESVTYLVQRAESLAGLCTLLALYSFARSARSITPQRWLVASIVSCWLGALTKESAATAPLLIFLYDRIFISGSFRAAWTRHRIYYSSLAASWIITGWLIFANPSRGGTTGFATPVSVSEYALLQLQAVSHYLRLSLWPQHLVFDYGPYQAGALGSALPSAIIIGIILGLTGWTLRRKPTLGFLGAVFFILLAPSSSFLPIASQIMAEHRMYLPLAALVTLIVILLQRYLGRGFLWLVLILTLLSVARTAQRNGDYQSNLKLWTATVQDCPTNPRAWLNLGQAYAAEKKWAEAARHYETALRLQPKYIMAHYNLGVTYLELQQPHQASEHFATTLQLNPAFGEAAYNWGNALAALQQPAAACARYEYALRLHPHHARAHYNLGNSLIELGRFPEAIVHYEETIRLNPTHLEAYFNLGNALSQTGRFTEAIAAYQAVLQLAPHDTEAARNLASAHQAIADQAAREKSPLAHRVN